MKLLQSFIDEVLSRIDIVDTIEKRISLKKTGKGNYTGLCPFHQEKTPSFAVSQGKQFYYCFGCKASGNAIDFLRTYDKLSFIEAVEVLALKANLNMPDENNKETAILPSHLALLKNAANFFQAQLKESSAQSYLQKRGLTNEMIKRFELGFVQSGWNNLKTALGGTLSKQQALVEIGLLVENKPNQYYDRFRSRLIFPIKNKRGQIIAFGGRSIDNQMPKYLNSPETAYFHKSQELYGLYESLQATKNITKFIIVEGYLDVIALHQYGITEAVATLGTAISLQHIHTLLRYTDTLYFCFDGDQAGETAAWRALEMILPLMNTGYKINFLLLGEKMDPDSFVRIQGGEAFLTKLADSLTLPDFFYKRLLAKNEIESITGKTRLAHIAEKYLRKIPKGIFQTLMYEALADAIGMNLARIQEILPSTSLSTVTKAPNTFKINIEPTLRLALCLLIQKPNLISDFTPPENFYMIQMKGMDFLIKILLLAKQNPLLTTGALFEHVDEEQDKFLFQELATQELLIPEESWAEELQGAIKRISELEKEHKIFILMQKGKKAGFTEEEKQSLQKLLLDKNE